MSDLVEINHLSPEICGFSGAIRAESQKDIGDEGDESDVRIAPEK
jgi:hypothetical protein